MQKISILILAVAMNALVGCASIVNGTNQSVSVQTGAVENATCSLSNNKGTWYVNKTPGSVMVNRSYDDLDVVCHKKGLPPAEVKVRSVTKAMAFGNIVF